MPSNQIRLLALDGGGVRGLSSLMILQQLMATIDPESPPKPCEYFDMIGGTSTGGLIAIMLGRLQMTVDECIKAYTSLSDKVFEKKRHRLTIGGKVQGRFSAADLEQAVKQLIRDRGLAQDTLLMDSPNAPCKVKQTGDIVCLTSYRTPRGGTHLLPWTKIWQACRATSAATSFFDPIAIGAFEEEFADGALGANNPIYTLWNQAQDIWGDQLWSRLSCLVSIGTGVSPLKPVHDDIYGIFSTLKSLATETETTSEQFRRDKSSLDDEGRYYRFNVDRGLENIGLEESKKKKEIAAATGRYIMLQDTFKQVQACVAKLTGQEFQCQSRIVAKKSVQYALSTEDQACLRDLQTTNPRDDKGRIEMVKGGLLKDAYHWILDNDDFRQWRCDLNSRLLWIKGDPGKGKTMLLCGIIDELTSSLPDTTTISFFFCQASDPRLNEATAVLRGLIYLLIDKQPSLISHLRGRYDQAGRQLFEGVNAWEAVSKIFSGILEDPLLQSTYLVIDALDECTTDLALLLDFVARKSSAYPLVKWIVSSRNWPAIEECLDTATQKVRLWLELNEKSVSEAVTVYIHHKVQKLTERKKYNDDLRDAVSHYLLSNAQGTFLWVALVCEKLAKAARWHASQLLTAFPPGLEPLYGRMLEQIRGLEDAELCKRILAIVSAVYRPITLDELPALVDMPDDISNDNECLAEIIGACGSFLTLREGTIFFVHQSAKDFLLQKASNEIFARGIEAEHYTIFSRSLQVLNTLQRDTYKLKSPGFPIDQVRQPNPDPLAAARYSCLHWVDHLQECDANNNANEDLQAGGSVEEFLKENYLHWLEALSLLRGLSEGIAAMLKLDNFLQKMDELQAIWKRVYDASRFIRYHRVAIESSPLQVYSSSLIFSPDRSLTRDCYEKDRPKLVLNESAIQDDWSPCLHTLEGHSDSVESVAWSHDGSRLVSASLDKTVRIWDPATGQCTSILEGHNRWDRSIAWSPDGSRLASESVDYRVRIWGQATRQYISTLEGHNSWVRSIAWSHDGSRLASGSEDKTVRIWDPATGQCMSTIRGHRGPVWSIAWSHDGSRLASASQDKTVRIWDLATGRSTSILEGHDSWVRSIAWSYDGSRLASGSEDKTVRIWDPATGQCMSTIEGHRGAVWSIAWSHDSAQLASGSVDCRIRIWDPATGQCTSTLEGHSVLVMSIAWSHDGSRLASASLDKTVKIWDPAAGQCRLAIEGHSGPVRSITWSHDGSRLASASHDKTVRIWDPATGECTSTLEGHDSWVRSIAWSHDGSRLASWSFDHTVRIWNPTTGQCTSTIERYSLEVTSIAWSYDGSQLALASLDTTVEIWDLATGQCTSIIEGHSGPVRSIAWSHDGSRLASASDDKTVRIWNSVTRQRTSTLDVDCSSDIHFDPNNLHLLHTSVGAFNLGSDVSVATSPNPSVPLPQQVGYGLTDDSTWITYRGENLLWLPPEYRPRFRSWAISAATVAIGCFSGRVLFLRLSEDNPVS